MGHCVSKFAKLQNCYVIKSRGNEVGVSPFTTFKPLALEMDIYVKCEYFTNQKSNVMKYTTFGRGIN